VYAHQGFLAGIFPPGAQSLRRTVRVVKNMLLAHGRSYRIIHRLQNNARAGTAHNLQLMIPDNPDNPLDRYAAAVLHQVANRTTLEAAIHGRLTPLIGYGQLVPQLLDSSDYIGLNYYTTVRAAFDLRNPAALFTRRFFGPDAELTDLTRGGYAYSQYDPGGMYLALKTVAEYGKPIYITENGIPDHDDDLRPRFLVTYLAEAWRAIQEGVPLKGYYHWTLIDNFEWCEGWNLKFGLIEIDHETGQRTLKRSAEVFREMATRNGLPRALLAEVAPGYVVNAG
jgi:beta-glucosidase